MAQNRRTVVDPRAAERRNSLYFKIGTGVVVVLLIAVIAGVLIYKNANKPNEWGGDATPTVVTEDGSIRMSGAAPGTQPKAVVTITEDFQCPACGQFEKTMGETVVGLAARPDVAVDYRTISFLDLNFKNKYSTSTMNASLCVAEATGKKGDFTIWKKYHDLLFANQVEEGTEGIPDDKLVALAKEAGAPDAVESCITDRSYGQWIRSHSDDVMANKFNPGQQFQGTPWVLVNGKTVNVKSPEELTNAVNAAVAEAK